MTRRVCLGVEGKACGQLIAKGSRCHACAGVYERERQVGRRALYTSSYRRRAVATIARQPWCSWCDKTTDLTADHVITGDPVSPLRVLCRGCNAARANRRGAL
jgi:hypothetical protein